MVVPSSRQEEILEFISGFIARSQYPPTLREIQHGLNLSSVSLVVHHVRKLEMAGSIKRIPEISRGLILLDKEPV